MMAVCTSSRQVFPGALKTYNCILNQLLLPQCGAKYLTGSASFLCSRNCRLLDPIQSFHPLPHHHHRYHQNTAGLVNHVFKCNVATLSLFDSFWKKITFRSGRKHSKTVLKKSALRLYLCCIELVSHDTFIRELHLPDTFNSWFRITELHLWMLMVRLRAEGKDGQLLRNTIVEYAWQDIDKKTKKLGELATMTSRKEGVLDLSEQFKAALFNYDEGLLGDDKQLAGALWRNFFDRNCNNAHHLEKMVEYVRRQIQHLDQYPSEEILKTGIIEFEPLVDSMDMRSRNKLILVQILKRI